MRGSSLRLNSIALVIARGHQQITPITGEELQVKFLPDSEENSL
jgi:hypothetical protein